MISIGRGVSDRYVHLAAGPLTAVALCTADGLSRRRTAVAAGIALGGGLLTDSLLGPDPLTPADHVTRFRSSLIAALAARSIAGGRRRTGPQAAVFTLAVGLDAVDGMVARRTGCTTPRGWRFDLEADAAAMAVLACTVAHRAPWVVVPGALRYVFGGARQVVPALRGGLQPRLSRRVIAGGSTVALVITTWPGVPDRAAQALSAGATVALLSSFTRDTVDLLRGRAPSPEAQGNQGP